MNIVAFDFETYYDKEYSLSKVTTEEYIRDPKFEAIMVSIAPFVEGKFHPTVYKGKDIVRGINTIDWENSMAIAWNCHFDAAILSWRYRRRIGMPICAMAMFRMMGLPTLAGGESLYKATQYLLESGLAEGTNIIPKGDEVVQALGKRLADMHPVQIQAYSKYCAEDAVNAGEICKLMISMGFAKSELAPMGEIIRCFSEPGIHLSTALAEKYNQEQAIIQRLALERAGVTDVGQLRSDVKFAEVLRVNGCEEIGMKRNAKGQLKYAFAKSDDFMFDLLNGDDELLANIAEARVANKTTIAVSRSQRFVDISKRGVLPVMLNPGGAHTTRLSGGDKVNLQNTSKKGDIRKSIDAGHGHKFIGADQAQIELRMNGYVSGDWDLVEAFREGRDNYSEYGNNSGMFDHEISRATVDERFMCKGIVLGGGFGSGARALEKQIINMSRGLGLDIDTSSFDFEEAKNAFRRQRQPIVRNWYATGRQLEQLIQGQSSQRGTDGLVHYEAGKGFRFPNGMHIWYRNLRIERTEKVDPETGAAFWEDQMWFDRSKFGRKMKDYIYPAKAVENYIQGLAALMLREQWAEIVRRARKEIGLRWGAIKLQVHDELVARVVDAAVEDFKALMLDVMTRSPVWAPGLPLEVEVSVGQTYKDIS